MIATAGTDAADCALVEAVRAGDDWILEGVKRWITNAGVSDYYTVFAVTDPDAGKKGISEIGRASCRERVCLVV